MERSSRADDTVLLWAVAANGSVLRREGVTALNPQGESWEAVLSEHVFRSLSVGARRRVWAVTESGAPALRLGVGDDRPDGTRNRVTP